MSVLVLLGERAGDDPLARDTRWRRELPLRDLRRKKESNEEDEEEDEEDEEAKRRRRKKKREDER